MVKMVIWVLVRDRTQYVNQSMNLVTFKILGLKLLSPMQLS